MYDPLCKVACVHQKPVKINQSTLEQDSSKKLHETASHTKSTCTKNSTKNRTQTRADGDAQLHCKRRFPCNAQHNYGGYGAERRGPDRRFGKRRIVCVYGRCSACGENRYVGVPFLSCLYTYRGVFLHVSVVNLYVYVSMCVQVLVQMSCASIHLR
jgi:hypothetical protein